MRSQKETYVYVILELPVEGYPKQKQRFIKIGRTIDIERRISQFSLCTPREFEVVDLYGPYQHEKAKKLEKELHTLCCAYHVKGEWFEHEAIDLVFGAMKVDETMNIFEKQDIQKELKSKLEKQWVLATVDVEVKDREGHAHVLDISLHTGEYIYGRVTIGQLTRTALPGIEEIQCARLEDIDRVVMLAVNMQERHCRSQVVQMVA